MLHCFGILLNCHSNNSYDIIRDKYTLVANLVTGLQLPSEEIQSEILYILYKFSILQCASKDIDEEDVLSAFGSKLLHQSLDALAKTENDSVRLNCIALLTILAQRRIFGNISKSENITLSSDEADNFMQTTDEIDGASLYVLFAEAIKGPLLSSDNQVQISTLHLIFHCLSCEEDPAKPIQVLVKENIVDHVFEILRLAECKDPMVNSCLQVLNLFSAAEQAFRQRMVVGFTSLIPVLRYVTEIPFHPAQSQTLKLICNCVSDFPGIVSPSYMEELVLVLTRMFERHTEGEIGMLPETFILACTTFTALLKTSSSHGILKLALSVEEASKHALLSCLSTFRKDPNQFLHSLYLLKEAYAYSLGEISSNNPSNMELCDCIMDICSSQLLPWFVTVLNEMDEESVLGIMETFHFILLQSSDSQATKWANTLVSASWFSLSFGCLGLFPTENMKLRTYLMLSSLVDVLLGQNIGKSIRDAALYLPSDPVDLLFLLGQKRSLDMGFSSCQSAVLLILHASSLYDDRLADEKLVLSSLEQFILANGSDFLHEIDSLMMMQLVNLYGRYRGVGMMNYQIPFSPEAERIMFHLLTEKEWDLSSCIIHLVSLKWLFQQEKISKQLSSQLLTFCRLNSGNRADIIVHKKHSQTFNVNNIAELVIAGDNYVAPLLVCLLLQLAKEEGQGNDIIAVVNLMATIINIFPPASEYFCLHGIGNGVQAVLYNSIHSSSEIFKPISLLVLSILSLVHSETLSRDEAWVTVTIKLMDFLITTLDVEGWNCEGLEVIGILSLVLHHSTNKVLLEAAKAIIFNTSLISSINSMIRTACSKGPALFNCDEKTGMGEALIYMLLLFYFSLRSLHAVLPEFVDWHHFVDQSNLMQQLSTITIQCTDLCRLMHFGPPTVKLVASYCVLEIFTRLTEQVNRKKEELECSMDYQIATRAILEGLVFHSDIRVARNCAFCLSMIIGWEKLGMQETRFIAENRWCRLIVEEMAMSLAVPCLASKSFTNHHKSAVYITVALLKLQNVPRWMGLVFNDCCISNIIDNLSASNVSSELIFLFRELSNNDFVNTKQIGTLKQTLQACRKHLHMHNAQCVHANTYPKKTVATPEDLGEVHEYLIHLMSSEFLPDTDSRGREVRDKRLLEEIELFFKAFAVSENI
ncbi:protein PUTATIVE RECOMBINATION INITIATION DEFECT 1-like isoform X2 [Tripterygium wilfordii]|nr:protein PUTATIVE RECOMBINATION INITIATION DEFECT 1-like isoform X2 [Tripterygium wilfordii]